MKKKVNKEEHINQNIKINELETSNRILQEKLQLLKIQLQSQSELQAAAYSYHKTTSSHRSHPNLHSSRNLNTTASFKSAESLRSATEKSYELLYHQLNILQEEFQNVKEQNRNRISELETQVARKQNSVSPNTLKTELNENVELIKLKRLSKKQSTQILSLQSQLEIANAEIKQLQTNLSTVTTKKESLQAELSNKKSEIAKFMSDISTLKENNKLLEEQLNDLQIEKTTLKEHNENLLKLSLQKEAIVKNSDNKSAYLRQIKEIEENFKKELNEKSELLSKFRNAELLNVKLQHELSMNTSVISEMQTNNSLLKDEIEKLKINLKNTDSKINHKYNSSPTEEKSVMTMDTGCSNISLTNNINDFLANADKRDEINSNLKMQLYQISTEHSQSKELLRVQYSINNKYKREIEELQQMLQKKGELSSDYLHNFRDIFSKYEKKLLQIKNENLDNDLSHTVTDLLFVANKLNHQNFICCIDKLFSYYVMFLKKLYSQSSNLFELKKKDVTVNAIIENTAEYVQVEKDLIETEKLNANAAKEETDSKTEETDSKELTENSDTGTLLFELRIEKANFDYFAEHLMKSAGNNPRIFLTWNFFNDNKFQAYTPTISVNDGMFNCSCQYEGPFSEVFYQYLNQDGIHIEIHLVQEEISVKLGEALIDTCASLCNLNNYQTFVSYFESPNIKGSIVGNYILKCDANLVENYIKLIKT